MAIKIYRPMTAGRRNASVMDFSDITKTTPEKALVRCKLRTGGRNNLGRRTSCHRGGGHKKLYRQIDFLRNKFDVPATVAAIEYDPNRSANIALLFYKDGEKRYIIAPEGLRPGMKVLSSQNAIDADIGCAMPLSNIPVGAMIHNIELQPGRGAQLVRTAGAEARLMSRETEFCAVRMPSGEMRLIASACMATVGQVGNIDHSIVKIGKAGRNRWLGKRPWGRGMAKNPVSHPMGGGEGRSKSGRIPCSPTGVLAKGKKTRHSKKATSKYILRRRK